MSCKVIQCDICKKTFPKTNKCINRFKRKWTDKVFSAFTYGCEKYVTCTDNFDICDECLSFISDRINKERLDYDRQCQNAYNEALRKTMCTEKIEKSEVKNYLQASGCISHAEGVNTKCYSKQIDSLEFESSY